MKIFLYFDKEFIFIRRLRYFKNCYNNLGFLKFNNFDLYLFRVNFINFK